MGHSSTSPVPVADYGMVKTASNQGCGQKSVAGGVAGGSK